MKDKQQTNMEAKTQKNETKLGKDILHKRNKEQKHKVQIRVSGHEYSCACIGPIRSPVVCVYACAYSKHVYVYTP